MFRVLFLLCLLINEALPAQRLTVKPVSIIFDTDMGPDYDDVGAIALLHAFADSGKANLLATVASTNYEGVAAVLQVLNTYFGRPNLQIGVPKGKAVGLKDWQHWTDTLQAAFPHTITRNNEVPDAVAVYRKTLAAQPDNSVTVITVGFLTNLANLLHSPADEYSPLNGKDLVNLKVSRLVSMAGRFPSGKEFNVEKDAAASKYVCENWPTPVLFSGWEIGSKIKTGLNLINDNAIQNSPVKKVFSICMPLTAEDYAGRMTWDETAVLVAVNGYEPFYTTQKGTMMVSADGSNTWDTGTQHEYLVEALPPEEVQKIIEELMKHQPVKH